MEPTGSVTQGEAPMVPTAGHKETVQFTLTKQTKGALMFSEVAQEGVPERIGSLYLRKWQFRQPYPDSISVQVNFPPASTTGAATGPAKVDLTK